MGLEPAWWLVREAEGEQCPGEVGVGGWCGLLQSLGPWDAPTGLTPDVRPWRRVGVGSVHNKGGACRGTSELWRMWPYGDRLPKD